MGIDSDSSTQQVYKNKLKKLKIGGNIRYHREMRNMSIDELSRLSGLSPAFIGLIERGQRGCALHNLMQFSDIMSIPINELIYGTPKYVSDINPDMDSRSKLLNSLLIGLDLSEVDFIISVLRDYLSLKSETDKV